jgi:hypothetical protein
VMVLEKHADFLRDFRGDTIHPSTLEIMYELGLGGGAGMAASAGGSGAAGAGGGGAVSALAGGGAASAGAAGAGAAGAASDAAPSFGASAAGASFPSVTIWRVVVPELVSAAV